MDTKLTLWTLALCVDILVWFSAGLSLDIDYERHSNLIEPKTGAKLKPIEVFNLTKVIRPSEQYINSTTAQQRLYDLQYNMEFENPFVVDQTYSDRRQMMQSGWPVSNQTKCGMHLRWILSKLSENRNYTQVAGRLGHELTGLMDSYGRPEAGTFAGSLTWLGSHEQCTKTTLKNGKVKTRYCFAKMRPNWWPEGAVKIRTLIRIGICLPETCDTLSFEQYKSSIEVLAKFELPEAWKESLNFDSMFCLPDERSPIRRIPLSGRIYLCVVGFWLALVLVASVLYELQSKKKQFDCSMGHPLVDLRHSKRFSQTDNAEKALGENLVKQLVNCLAIRNSLKIFKSNTFRVKRNSQVRLNLGLLDFFKVVMIMLIVLGHSVYLISFYSKSLSIKIATGTDELVWMTLSATRLVDAFFVFFGLLAAYTMMRKHNIDRLCSPFVWLEVSLSVLLRIAPIFALVFWYSRSVSPYTGSGPWWDYGLDESTMKGACLATPWWRSIPYFGRPSNITMPPCSYPSWFLVSYAQISLLLPLLTYIICRMTSQLARIALVAFLTAVSSSLLAIRLYNQSTFGEEGFSLYGGFLTISEEKYEQLGHSATLGRLGSVSIGCLVGYLLRMYEMERIRQWPRWLRSRLVFGLMSLMMLLLIVSPAINYRVIQFTGRLASTTEFVISNTVVSIAWSIIVGLLVLHEATVGNHLPLARFFSHTFWHAFNRLGLCIYMVHWEILFVGVTSFEQGPSYGFMADALKLWCLGMVASIAISFLIHILIEQPLSALSTLILTTTFTGKKADKRNEQQCIAPENGALGTSTTAPAK